MDIFNYFYVLSIVYLSIFSGCLFGDLVIYVWFNLIPSGKLIHEKALRTGKTINYIFPFKEMLIPSIVYIVLYKFFW